jgi:hypothetical protein
MAPAVEPGLQTDRQNLVGEAECDNAAAHREDVGVVVLPRETGSVEIVAERSADTGDLVGGDLFSLAAATEHDAAIGAAFGDCAADAQADRRIVDRRFAVGAMIVDEVTKTGERLLEMFFENESRVICANRDTHNAKLYYGSAFGVPASRFVSYEHEASNLEP